MKLTMQKDVAETSLQKAFNEFLFVKKHENVTEDTIRNYKNIIKFFIEFYGGNAPCSKITSDTITEYIAYLRKKPKKRNNPQKQDIIEPLSSSTN